MKKCILILLVSILYFGINAQSNIKGKYPVVGEACPDFILKNIHYYSQQQASLKDFRGKWLVLDFWSEYCGACLKSFPKINTMQQEFQGKVQFIMVGIPGKKHETIRSLYEKCRSKYNLQLPVAYDERLADKFAVEGLPFIIIIDPHGIVKAITYTLNSDNIKDLLAGRKTMLPRNYRLNETPKENYDYNAPLIGNENRHNDSDFLYRVILMKWKETIPKYSIRLTNDKFEALGVDLKTLYRLAYAGIDQWAHVNTNTQYYGKFYPDPILEVADSSLFKPDAATGENIFCYISSLPESKMSNLSFRENIALQRRMQHDLESYFHFTAQIEIRKMPYYKLVATTKARKKLKTKGGPSLYKELNGPKQGILAKNIPMQAIIDAIDSRIGSPNDPIINETGIDENIDITLDAIYFDDAITALRENGLDLIKCSKEMKVLIIRDKTPSY